MLNPLRIWLFPFQIASYQATLPLFAFNAETYPKTGRLQCAAAQFAQPILLFYFPFSATHCLWSRSREFAIRQNTF